LLSVRSVAAKSRNQDGERRAQPLHFSRLQHTHDRILSRDSCGALFSLFEGELRGLSE
jgi:hypothetical protein